MKFTKIYTVNKKAQDVGQILSKINSELRHREILAVQGYEVNDFIILNFMLSDDRQIDQQIYLEGYCKVIEIEDLMNARISSLPDNYLVKKALLIPSSTLRVLGIIVTERIDNGTQSTKETPRAENKKTHVKPNPRAKG